jgi:hypothetical protein
MMSLSICGFIGEKFFFARFTNGLGEKKDQVIDPGRVGKSRAKVPHQQRKF